MMEAVTSKQMYDIDRRAVEETGIPEIVLMENAGVKVFESIKESFGLPRAVCVISGRGNNGGDGAVAARHLSNAGSDVRFFIVGGKNDLKNSSKINISILEKVGIKVNELTKTDDMSYLEETLKNCDLVIDAIFGIGLKDDISGISKDTIDLVNKNKRHSDNRQNYRVVSIDIPSGIDADSGQIKGVCINADMTVTLHLPKTGLLVSPGLENTGKLVVADIGIPYAPANTKHTSGRFTTANTIKGLFKFRKTDSNKGNYGKILLIAGSTGMAGAAIMCARAALRSGAGLVYLSVPKSLQNHVNCAVPEAITLSDLSVSKIKAMGLDAIAIGPGLGLSKKRFVKDLIKANLPVPLVIDADALNSISDAPLVLRSRKNPTIVTPHPGELSRMMKLSVNKIQDNRVDTALKAAATYKTIVILKGANTVIADPAGEYHINTTGNPAMAAAGMGDVLTGMITALIGQGITTEDAAIAGTFLHGAAGDVVASLKGETGIIAGDIIEALPYLMKGLSR